MAFCLVLLQWVWVSNGSRSLAVFSHTSKQELGFCFLPFGVCSFLFCVVLLFVGHQCSSSYDWQSKALCSAEWMLLVHYAHLWTTGHFSIHLVRQKMRITYWTSQGDHLQRGLQYLMGMEYMRTKKRGVSWRRPNWAGQQTAAKVTNSVIKEESCSAFNSHSKGSSLCVDSELTWELASLFHRFSMP